MGGKKGDLVLGKQNREVICRYLGSSNIIERGFINTNLLPRSQVAPSKHSTQEERGHKF